ncbi:MAG TPA: TRAP transporter substrate-binding protein [Ilumatobacteraceae bacterium]|nr:TRAP transporter substrate-binding protein [Ilumatobacteraceae bacterium]
MKSNKFHAAVVVGATLAFTLAACGGSTGDKSGGAARRSLRLGTVENEGSPYADEVKEFAKAVSKLSNGSITVDVVWDAPGPFTGQNERKMAAMVSDGQIDLAVVPTRIWDELNVTTMQALQAPFLVDDLGLLNQIASGDLAKEMLSGLDAVGVKGMAIWPESLRHPIGFAHPLLTAAGFQGAKLRVPVSDASYRLAKAIGAEPVEPEADAAPGTLDGAESAFVWADGLPQIGTFTGNLTFYPKANTIVANSKIFDSLSSKQQNMLQQAATDTVAYVVKTNATEHDLAAEYCRAGGAVAVANDSDVADLVALAAPVLAELERDADVKRLIDEISALKGRTTPDPAAAATACGSTADDGAVASDAAEFPAGVYRAEFTRSDGKSVVATMTFADGAWTGTDNSGEGDCTGTYVVVSGRLQITTPSDRALACGNPPNFMFFDAAWTLENGELRLIDIKSDANAIHDFGSQPWTLIEAVGDSAAPEEPFPEGVYRAEVDYPDQSGPPVVTTLTLLHGAWTQHDEGGDCGGTFVVESGRIRLTMGNETADVCGTFAGATVLDAAWTFDAGVLRFVDLDSAMDKGAVAVFGPTIWTKTD